MDRVLPPSSPPPETESAPPESESPPQKKLKIDEEDTDSDSTVFSDELNDTSSPIRPTYSQYDSDEDYCPYYPQKMDKPLWDKYFQQVNESEGFDITDFPGQCAMTTVYPMPNYLNDPKDADTMRDYAGKALKLYNDERGTNYEVNNVLTVNGGGCRDFIFYITFSVKTNDGEDDIFQAKVVRDLNCHLQFPTMLLGLFKNVDGCVSDSPNLVYFWRIRHGCGIKSEESAQLRFPMVRPKPKKGSDRQ